MFSTTLRQRPDLPGIVPLLTSNQIPKLHETTLTTHDLALPKPSISPSTTTQPHHYPQPTYHLFLLLTPTSLTHPTLHERLTRFSTLTATPAPTLAFILSPQSLENTPSTTSSLDGTLAYMHLQTLIHTHPTPPPLLPIPTLAHLLPLLKLYTTTTPSPPPPIAPPPPTTTLSPLTLLPHTTSAAPARPLSTHSANILSDLCHSLGELIAMAGTERGMEMLGEWVGRREAMGLREFWMGEWCVE